MESPLDGTESKANTGDDDMNADDEEEIEVEDGKCVVDGVDTWVVEKITDMRYNTKKGYIEFFVTWEADDSATWEPLTSFSEGYDHIMIKAFKEENEAKFDRIMNQATGRERAKKQKPKSGKHWTYVTRDEDCYEKPDVTAPREAKSLADPNRLEDPQEKFLKSPSTPKQQKEKKKRGRKRKGENEAQDSSVAIPTTQSNSNSEKVDDVPEVNPDNQKPEERNTEFTMPAGIKRENTHKLVRKVEPLARKKRPRKLNSSDSSEEDEIATRPIKEKKLVKRMHIATPRTSCSNRIEGGANSYSMSPNPESDRVDQVTETNYEVNSIQSETRRNDGVKKMNSDVMNASSKSESRNIYVRSERVCYNSDDEFEKAFGDLHIKTVRGPPRKPTTVVYRNRANAEESAQKLDCYIRGFNLGPLEDLLRQKGPEKSFLDVCRSDSLHEVLTYAFLNPTTVDDTRMREMEKVIRLALAYLPSKILSVTDSGTNTLLHRAIHAKAENIARFLINMGSPLHSRNEHRMTPVEAACAMKNFRMLDLLIKYGGTFHHFLYDTFIPGCDHYDLRTFLPRVPEAIDIAKANFAKLNNACGIVRSALITTQLREIEHGPIVCFPREKWLNNSFKLSIQFMIPENWIHLKATKFMLVVMPMSYNQKQNRFRGATRVPSKIQPVLCGQYCSSMTKNTSSIFYDATAAISNHFNNFKSANRKLPVDEYQPIHPRLCTITLDIASRAIFHFMACQLITYKPLKKDSQSFQNGSSYPKPYGDRYRRQGHSSIDGNRQKSGYNKSIPPHLRPTNHTGPSTSGPKNSYNSSMPR
ncbi:hypothetical protein CAEBREN_32610 [Caenorhabditis brenneri]|uniref:Chromo domain-containing protein n=1 Tax=Caenorhabditis brenneri TaxID=135651 RepID=G0PBU5_CAEBE|nr:hypothetical protein CAEBREN_32610 [Caenorhabditis brenneri]